MGYPRPDRYTGVDRDGGILRNFDGRRGINVNTDGDLAADFEWRRNAKDSFDEADIGGDYS